MAKNNIDALRDILKEFESHDPQKAKQADKFVLSMREDIKTMGAEIKRLKDFDGDETGPNYDNSDFVGLDTLHWSLDSGNLKIQSQMENFIEQLKSENCVGANV